MSHLIKIKIFKNKKYGNESIMNAAEMLHQVKTQLCGSSASLKLNRIFTLKKMFETLETKLCLWLNAIQAYISLSYKVYAYTACNLSNQWTTLEHLKHCIYMQQNLDSSNGMGPGLPRITEKLRLGLDGFLLFTALISRVRYNTYLNHITIHKNTKIQQLKGSTIMPERH